MDREDFDEAAATWDEGFRVARAQAVAEQICRQVPVHERMRVLEFGCGTGLLGFALLPRIGHLTLADPSPGMIAEVQRKIAGLDRAAAARVDTLLLDAERPFPSGRYDLVVTLMTLHHVADVDGAIARLADRLAPGGCLALADLDREDGSFHGPDVDVHRGFSRAAIRERLAACGLRNPGESTPYVMRKMVDGGERSYPLFLITACRQVHGASSHEVSRPGGL